MKPEDCDNWRNYHCHLHIDFGGWLKSLSPDEFDDFVSATESCLLNVPLDRAKQISEQMFSGEVSKPFAFSAHPAAIKLHGEPKNAVASGTEEIRQRIARYRREAEADPMPATLGREFRKLLAINKGE